MNKIVNLMIDKYKLKEYGLDFMGYRITNSRNLTYHHLIVPRRNGGEETIENGAILLKKSHKYLHLIEREDYNLYISIRRLLIKENRIGEIDLTILRDINCLLIEFEKNNDVIDIYKNRFLRNIDKEILDNIENYRLIKIRWNKSYFY